MAVDTKNRYLQKTYDFLKQTGMSGLPDYDKFVGDMQNSEKRQSVYKKMSTKMGGMPDFDKFSELVGMPNYNPSKVEGMQANESTTDFLERKLNDARNVQNQPQVQQSVQPTVQTPTPNPADMVQPSNVPAEVQQPADSIVTNPTDSIQQTPTMDTQMPNQSVVPGNVVSRNPNELSSNTFPNSPYEFAQREAEFNAKKQELDAREQAQKANISVLDKYRAEWEKKESDISNKLADFNSRYPDGWTPRTQEEADARNAEAEALNAEINAHNAQRDEISRNMDAVIKEDEALTQLNPTRNEADVKQTIDTSLDHLKSQVRQRTENVEKQRLARVAEQTMYAPQNAGLLNFSKNDDETRYDATNRILERIDNLIAESNIEQKEDKNSNWIKDIWHFEKAQYRGAKDKIKDGAGFDFGLKDLKEMKFLNDAIKKNDMLDAIGEKILKGEKVTPEEKKMFDLGLSESESDLLDAAALEVAVQSMYDTGMGYTVGEIGIEMIPFMLEIAVNPLAAVGEGVGNGVLRYAIKHYGAKGLKKGAKKALVSVAPKLFQVGTDLTVGGVGQALTTGAAHTFADYNRRKAGNIRFDIDDSGEIVYSHADNQMGSGKALATAIASQSLEYSSENLSEWFKPLAKGLGATAKGAGKANIYTKMMEQVAKLDSKGLGKVFSDIRKYGHIGSITTEYLEEVLNNAGNGIIDAIAEGKNDFTTEEGGVFNLHDNIETFLGVTMPQIYQRVLAGGLQFGAHSYDIYRERRQRGEADRYARKVFGKQKWEFFKSMLDTKDTQSLVDEVTAICSDPDYPVEEKMAFLNYAKQLLASRGEELAARQLQDFEFDNDPDYQDLSKKANTEGFVIPATLNDGTQVYIKSELADDSGSVMVYNPETGEIYQVPADTISPVGEPLPVDEEAGKIEKAKIFAQSIEVGTEFEDPNSGLKIQVVEVDSEGLPLAQVTDPLTGEVTTRRMTVDEVLSLEQIQNGNATEEERIKGLSPFDKIAEGMQNGNQELAERGIAELNETISNLKSIEDVDALEAELKARNISDARIDNAINAKRKQIEEEIKAEEERIQKIEDESYTNLANTLRDSNITEEELQAEIEATQKEINNNQNEESLARGRGMIRAYQEKLDEVRKKKNEIPDFSVDKAEDARERGFRMVNGERVDRQEPIADKVEGKETNTYFSTKDVANGKVTIVDASVLQPSHTAQGKNPYHFIPEAQPKNRATNESQSNSDLIAQNMNPDLITSTATAFTGAPVVNSRGEAIQGNNRIIALQKMWSGYKESADKYKQYLLDNADSLGLDKDAIERMQNPVLVNMLDVDDAEAIRLGQFDSHDMESGAGEIFKAKQTMEKMSANEGSYESFINILLNDKGDEELAIGELIRKNAHTVLKWMADRNFITAQQYANCYKNGVITPEAVNVLKEMVERSLFDGGVDNIEELFNTLKASSQGAILSILPRDISVPENARLKKFIQLAIEVHGIAIADETFAKSNTIDSARAALTSLTKQTALFGTEIALDPKKYSNFALTLAAMFKVMTKKNLRNAFNDYYDKVLGKASEDMFAEDESGTKMSADEAAKAVFGVEINTKKDVSKLPGSNVPNDGPAEGGQRGQGNGGTPASGERGEAGAKHADGQGGLRPDGGKGTGTPKIKKLRKGATKEEAKKFFDEKYGKDSPRAKKELEMWELLNDAYNLHAIVDPEKEAEKNVKIFKLGVEIGLERVKDGLTKFIDWAKDMLESFGEAIRQHLKKIYFGIYDEVDDDVYSQMDEPRGVRSLDINSITVDEEEEEDNDEGEVTDEETDDTGTEVLDGTTEGVADDDNRPSGNDDRGDSTGKPAEGNGTVGETERGDGDGTVGDNGNSPKSGGQTSGGSGSNGGSTGRKSTDNKGTNKPTDGNTGAVKDKPKTDEGDIFGEDEDAPEETPEETPEDNGETDENQADDTFPTDGPVTPKEKVGAKEREREKAKMGEKKTTYTPHNDGYYNGTVVPGAMADAVDRALKRIEKEFGSIDHFVLDELGYDNLESLYKVFNAEQIDGLAMAIYQSKKGQGFIIGDMGGIGKGRQGAGMIRWAVKQGFKPIYTTISAGLFTDIHRDLLDTNNGNLKPFIINSRPTEKPGFETGDSTEEKPKYLPMPSQEELEYFYRTGEVSAGYDFVLATYSQFNHGDPQSVYESSRKIKDQEAVVQKDEKGNAMFYPDGSPIYIDAEKDTYMKKSNALRKLAKGNMGIFDESHDAAGEGNTGSFFRSILKADSKSSLGFKSSVFLSATFAHNASAMALYANSTNISQADIPAEVLIDIVRKGGPVMQEILSQGLAESGQYIRRERDMTEGVKYNTSGYKSEEKVKEIRDKYDQIISLVSEFIKFQTEFVQTSVEQMDVMKFAKENGLEIPEGVDVDNLELVAKVMPFSSRMRIVKQMLLLATKAEGVADEAIEAIKRGEKPVITLENTLQTAISDMMKVDEDFKSLDFARLLNKYLENLFDFEVIVQEKKQKAPKGKKDDNAKKVKFNKWSKKGRLKTDDITEEGRKVYDQLVERLNQTESGLIMSPVDAMLDRIRKAGYTVGEYTSRNVFVEIFDKIKESGAVAALRNRGKVNKRGLIDQFNSGKLDCLIINSSGATGISLHASRAFKDQKPRVMIHAQYLLDIKKQQQMTWRVDRTNQVHRGSYIAFLSPIPSEAIYCMMYEKKLKSLNANTTSSMDTGNDDSSDMFNKYGSKVMKEFLADNPDFLDELQIDEKLRKSILDEEWTPANESLIKTILEEASFMLCEKQEYMINDITERYKTLINNLNEAGENDLVSTAMKLDAKLLKRTMIGAGLHPGEGNPFGEHVFLDHVEMNVLKKPLTAKDIQKNINKLVKAMTNDGMEEYKLYNWEDEDTVKEIFEERIYSFFEQQIEKAKKEAEKSHKLREKIKKQIREILSHPKEGEPATEEEIELAIERAIVNKNLVEETIESNLKSQINVIKLRRSDLINAVSNKHFTIGKMVTIPTVLISDTSSALFDDKRFYSTGMFLGFRCGKRSLTASSIYAVYAVADGRRIIELPMTEYKVGKLHAIRVQSTLKIGSQERDNTDIFNWDKITPSNAREEGYILTGNIIQAMASARLLPNNEGKGKLITYTKENGDVTHGYLLPTIFDPKHAILKVPASESAELLNQGRVMHLYYKNETLGALRRCNNKEIDGVESKPVEQQEVILQMPQKTGAKEIADILNRFIQYAGATFVTKTYEYKNGEHIFKFDGDPASLDLLLSHLSDHDVMAESLDAERMFDEEGNEIDEKGNILPPKPRQPKKMVKVNVDDNLVSHQALAKQGYLDVNIPIIIDDFYDFVHAVSNEPGFLNFFDRVYNVAKKIGLKFGTFMEARKPNGGLVIAYYHPLYNAIDINLNPEGFMSMSKTDQAHVILHEMIHSVTCYVMTTVGFIRDKGTFVPNGYRKLYSMLTQEQIYASERLDEIYRDIAKSPLWKNVEINDKYGLTNPREMVAEMSWEPFRDVVKSMSLWKKFIRQIACILHFKTDKDEPDFNKRGKDERMLRGHKWAKTNAITEIESNIDVILNGLTIPQYEMFLTAAKTGNYLVEPPKVFLDKVYNPKNIVPKPGETLKQLSERISNTFKGRELLQKHHLKKAKEYILASGKKNADIIADIAEDLAEKIGSRLPLWFETPESASEKRQAYLNEENEEDNTQFSVVSNQDKIDELEKGKKIKVYRAMQLIDGKLYPPMAAVVDKNLAPSAEFGKWLESEERPDLIKFNKKGNAYFVLNKGNGKSIRARYNPYWHTSRVMLNDQFSSAYDRPNLVVVECEIPESELTSGYQAQYAKDAVGETEWHKGPVSTKLDKIGKTRKVILSRWCKPIRIVPVEEVAQNIKKELEGTRITIPVNTVTPSLRAELEKIGVKMSKPSGTVKRNAQFQVKSPIKSANFKSWFGDWEKDPEHSSKVVDKKGRPLVLYRGSDVENLYKFNDYNTPGNQYSGFVWATADNTYANRFTRDGSNGNETHPERVENVFMDIKNPLDIGNDHMEMTFEALKKWAKEKGLNSDEVLYAATTNPFISSLLADKNYMQLTFPLAWVTRMPQFAKTIEKAGYDGVKAIERYSGDDWDDIYVETYGAIHSNQVKSATQNSGAFNPHNRDIRFSVKDGDMFLDDGTIYGWSDESGVHLTMDGINPETEIHEYGHLWIASMKENNPALYESLMRLMKGTAAWDTVANDPNYSSLTTDDAILSEAFCQYSGTKGQQKLVEVMREAIQNGVDIKDKSARAAEYSRLAKKLDRSWEWTTRMLNVDTSDFRSMDEAADMLLMDILEGGNTPTGTDTPRGYMPSGIPKGGRSEFSVGGPEVRPSGVASEIYERATATLSSKLEEGWVDQLISLANLQKAIAEESGKPIEDFENAYLHTNHLSSVNDIEQNKAERELTEPLVDAMNDVIKGIKGIDKEMKDDDAMDRLEMYLIAKHGLERNIVLARRDAQAQSEREYQDKIREAEENVKLAKRNLDRAIDDFNMGFISADELKSYQDIYEEMVKESTKVEEARKKREEKLFNDNRTNNDYSGLTETFGEGVSSSVVELEKKAQEYIDFIEGAIDTKTVDELWNRINAMNGATLKKSLDSGLISREQYNQFRNQYDYYVPLRSWNSEKAEDVYRYINLDNGKVQGSVIKAKGRKSRAGDILANMLSMNASAIVMGNKNKSKQALLRLAQNHPTKLISIKGSWYEKTATGDWIQSIPDIYKEDSKGEIPVDSMSADDITEFLAEYENRMEKLASEGRTMRSHDALKLGIPITYQQATQHAVKVLVGGKESIIYINGAPNAAQAINGLLNPDARSNEVYEKLKSANRFMARSYTSLNPTFLVRNLEKDVISAASINAIKFGTEYSAHFAGNVARLMPGIGVLHKGSWDSLDLSGSLKRGRSGIYGLQRRYREGKLDMTNELDRYYAEFLENGGHTGYSQLWSIEDYNEKLNRAIKKAKSKINIERARGMQEGLANAIEHANSGFENLARFATYMTSRQMGRSILISIADTKDASTNFNKKGSGTYGNRLARDLYVFINPAIQGVTRYIYRLSEKDIYANGKKDLTKSHQRARMVAATAFGIAFGALNTIINAMLGAGGDDDDNLSNDYWRLTTFKRRNYLNIYTGMDGYAVINLTPEEAVPYSIGAILAEHFMGYGHIKQMPGEILSQLSRLSPFGEISPNEWHSAEDIVKGTARAIAPSWYLPIHELTLNENFVGAQIYKEPYFSNDPKYMLTKKGTPEWQKNIAEKAYKSGLTRHWWWLGNPNVIEHLGKGFLGGLVEFPVLTFNLMMKFADQKTSENETISVNDTPLKAFWNSVGESYSADKAYKDEFRYYKAKVDDVDEWMIGNGIKKIADKRRYAREHAGEDISYQYWLDFDKYSNGYKGNRGDVNIQKKAIKDWHKTDKNR